MTAKRAFVGCSGWEYAHWRRVFYPLDVPRRTWLSHYASRFDTVEINSSFYRLPSISSLRSWRDATPDTFLFALKASRYLTHLKKLTDPKQPLQRLFGRVRTFGPKLGPVLYQLPPGWSVNIDRLAAFLEALPQELPASSSRTSRAPRDRGRLRHVIEFRDTRWYVDEVLALLEAHGVALCVHDMPGSESGRRLVGPFIYVRFHGVNARYGGGYGSRRLAGWADWLAEVRQSGRDAYVYFNNDIGGHAPHDALTLRKLLAETR
ncbi:MAG: DUF72 domain-containing protein [Luteitalea sp.]|nr:DUF72 domain-containing protein [Luteitalea sp.]